MAFKLFFFGERREPKNANDNREIWRHDTGPLIRKYYIRTTVNFRKSNLHTIGRFVCQIISMIEEKIFDI